MKDTILEVKDLSVTFTQYDRGFSRRTLHAVEKMDLSVRAGEIVAVVGSSGSGKSLLAHAIMGILPYNSAMDGEIRFLGTPLTAERVKKLRGHEIVFVPQSVSYLDPLMKIGDQIRNGKKDHSVKEKCLSVLKRYGLAPDIREKYPFQLSGGMTRRVLISTAVMETPKFVIADEPTPGLHMEAATRVMGHFREMADDGVLCGSTRMRSTFTACISIRTRRATSLTKIRSGPESCSCIAARSTSWRARSAKKA